jgi:hypothetical protein
MSIMGTQQAIQLFESLPNDLQREVVDFMEFLLVKREKADTSQPPVRRPGTLPGFVVYMAPDFDAPLEDFQDYM